MYIICVKAASKMGVSLLWQPAVNVANKFLSLMKCAKNRQQFEVFDAWIRGVWIKWRFDTLQCIAPFSDFGAVCTPRRRTTVTHSPTHFSTYYHGK